MRKRYSSINDVGKTGQPHEKKKKQDPQQSTQIGLKT